MRRAGRTAVLVTALATAWTTGLGTTSVQADESARPGGPQSPMAEGLTDPFGLTSARHRLVVTEAGAGRVRTIGLRTRTVRTVVRGLGPYAAASAVKVGKRFAIVTGEADPGAPPGPVPGSSVLLARPGGEPRPLADLMAHELEFNPDGQTQFGEEGEPLDALSNPFDVLNDTTDEGLVLVADGGANDVLRVDRHGDVSTFFVPPTVNTGACEGLENNDEETVGCDAVPTGLAHGPGDTVYVSALTAEVPGEGRIYVVDEVTGELQRTIRGFSGPTGVGVDQASGAVYVSELLENAPQGEPGPGFDPSTIGRVVRVGPGGARSYAQPPMPIGLEVRGGQLFSTTWSVAGLFLGQSGLGRVVRIGQRRFDRARQVTAERPSGSSGLGDSLRPRLR